MNWYTSKSFIKRNKRNSCFSFNPEKNTVSEASGSAIMGKREVENF